jgi:putative redox protein
MSASPAPRPVSARPERTGPFTTLIEVPGGPIHADEPASVGGGGAGPTPYELLSAALAACTSMTLRLYTARKPWAVPAFRVEVEHALIPGSPPRDRFTRRILFDGPLDDTLRERLLEIAEKCPVHRTLSNGGAEILTSAEAPAPVPIPPIEPADPPAAHVEQMERACVDCADGSGPEAAGKAL